jgi:hypothetical protein
VATDIENSLRLDILLAMVDTFKAVVATDPPAFEDFNMEFSTVELGSLGDEDHKKRYSLGIVPLRERYGDKFPFQERWLTVGFQFRVTVNRGDEKPGVMAERLLTVVERVVLANPTWGGLAIDTRLQSNENDMVDYGDKSVQGALFAEVHYRHSHLDPRDMRPDP